MGPGKTESWKKPEVENLVSDSLRHPNLATPHPQKWLDTAVVKLLTYDYARNRAPDDCAKGSKQLLEPIVASKLLDCDNYCAL